MADVRISALPVQIGADMATNDVFPMVDTSAGTTEKITLIELNKALTTSYNIRHYGAIGDNVTDDTAAIQSAITAALLTGGKLVIPRGLYKVTSTLTIDQSALTSSPDEKRVSIEGDGSGNSQLRWSGTGPCLRFIAGTSGGIHAFMTMRGFAIDGAGAIGQHGLKIENASWFELSDLKIQECDDGLIAEDCLSFEARSCVFRFNIRGVYVYRVDGSRPNNITFLDCEFGSNTNVGGHIVEAGGVRFIGGAIESNGTDAGQAIRSGLKIEDAGTQSGIGLYCEGVHFENNRDKADIWLDQTTTTRVLHHISGNAFLRVANSNYVTNPIRVDCDSGTPVQVNVIGNAFKGFNGYVPSAARPYVNTTNCLGTDWLVRLDGNHYHDTVEIPTQSANMRNVLDDVFQNVFRLTAAGSAIGPTIADFFGANSAFPTVASTVYELIFHIVFTKTTDGTVIFTLTNTQTYTALSAEYEITAATGMGNNGAPTKAGITGATAAASALAVTPTLTGAPTNHRATIRAIAEVGTAGNIRLQITSSAGTVTPQRGSFYTVRRISSNVGTFAA